METVVCECGVPHRADAVKDGYRCVFCGRVRNSEGWYIPTIPMAEPSVTQGEVEEGGNAQTTVDEKGETS